MMRLTATVLGAFLCLTGIVGFFQPDFLRMVLNPFHNGIMLVLGAIAIYFGMNGNEVQARAVCRILGIVFTAFGLSTLFSGPGTAMATGIYIPSEHVLKIVPGHLEFATADGVRDLLVGIIGLVTGFFLPRSKELEMDTKVRDMRRKMAGQH